VGTAEAPIFDFACECATLGCRVRVVLSTDQYRTALARPDRFVVVRESTSRTRTWRRLR